jgi:hypothetical protein
MGTVRVGTSDFQRVLLASAGQASRLEFRGYTTQNEYETDTKTPLASLARLYA